MSSLVAAAASQLDRPGRNSSRQAAWLARMGLEAVLDQLLAAKKVVPGVHASTRARLSCLEAVYRDEDPHLTARAAYAWSRLSEACHQHAYELSPTYGEVKHLIGIVRGLVPTSD